ncbi:tRNA threonylcarbamoyladenosine biosynthesis protein TsaB [Halanaerobium saccharolyticum]|uniref:tRNA threonylcarbamoyladenosine biosynthesis protein TsaB n=1 Tax=Halanaerobium saccharolyticum TaxID=43595 RepID=A0A4R7YWY6_9FIRM|nr:tRNA (adenosine(37)-N6)-threonylcarbamoyltransferase complex dimerization subunit type 1 TsaB [Halanaerobium saccharolyticum]RAK07088.1 tRNA threonylcarbamoyladenosine biosynthesis protein TsaB [Halanaerobium saccharolyticum]TDW01900.1 tRNA threonylcarbamoyladenosine biosynthesis protein TsaB [Halanaerobium saccharolyticum]TDX53146.1 tRNA threonylcarbamoyladenosine biosynthesis protein TsaB [Halanaerobium saccharolyticum]
MLILGIDTSTDILGLALMDSGQLKGEYNLSLKRQHSEKLLPLIEEIFELLGVEAGDLDGIAVAVGPGSFTGLRIGITTAKVLGRIFSIPVKGISTLEIMAAGAEGEYILPLLDARRKRVYYSFYQRNGNKDNNFLKEVKKAASAGISELPQILNEYQNQEISIIGEKTAEVRELLVENNFKTRIFEAEKNLPRAAVLARLGGDYICSGQADDIYQLKPAYLKIPQAEINWQQKYGSK